LASAVNCSIVAAPEAPTFFSSTCFFSLAGLAAQSALIGLTWSSAPQNYSSLTFSTYFFLDSVIWGENKSG